MIAPDHLRGPLSMHASRELRQERALWVAEKVHQGYQHPDIAKVLGISTWAVSKLCQNHGIRRHRPLRYRTWLAKYEVRGGDLAEALDFAPDDLCQAIMQRAHDDDLTAAEAMVAMLMGKSDD